MSNCLNNSNPEYAAMWRAEYAPVIPADGTWMRVYFPKTDGSIVEGYWRRNENDWSFKEVLPAGTTQDTGTTIAATMWDDGEVHLFYLSPENYIRELCLYGSHGNRGSPGSLNSLNIKTSSKISVISFHRDGAPNMRLYFLDEANSSKLREYCWGSYGHQKWEQGSTFDCQIKFAEFNAGIKFVNLAPWSHNSPSIRGYCEDAKGCFFELRWEEGGWSTRSLGQNIIEKDLEYRFATEFTVSATGAGRAPRINLFWLQNDKVYEVVKYEGDGHWSDATEVFEESERDGAHLAASEPNTGRDEVHLFVSGEGNKFIHRYRVDRAWRKEIVDSDR